MLSPLTVRSDSVSRQVVSELTQTVGHRAEAPGLLSVGEKNSHSVSVPNCNPLEQRKHSGVIYLCFLITSEKKKSQQ